MKSFLSTLILVLFIFPVSIPAFGEGLHLAEGGKTDYVIVLPEKASAIDKYAVESLAAFLRDKTAGAEFKVVESGKVPAGKKRIVVGTEDPVKLGALKDQDYVVKGGGGDILLYGKGPHGNLNAVFDFMEKDLGYRLYVESEYPSSGKWSISDSEPSFRAARKLVIQSPDRKESFSFKYRLPYNPRLFYYQKGLNMGFSEARKSGRSYPSGVQSLAFMPAIGHTFFSYIPPTPDTMAWPKSYPWMEKKDYFKTNPEFFTMTTNGKRVPLQLCFGNPELRKELTKNILKNIEILKKERPEELIINLSATDNGGKFCHCPACRKLEEKYKSPGGAFYDYLFELCALLKEKHPDVRVLTLAYRLEQTQKPPVMPSGTAFPDNLIVFFASLYDDADKTWNDPVNRPNYEDLLAWRALTPHLWVWYYPFSPTEPCANLDRLFTDLRLMKKAGVEGVAYEFTGYDYFAGYNFSELQRFLYTKLLKDVNADIPALIKEFTDYQYGAAAPLVRKYIQELEAEQKTASEKTPLHPKNRGFDRKLKVSAEALHRWQGYLDRMEKLTETDSRVIGNVLRLRKTLDMATLSRWSELSKRWPDDYKDPMLFRNRLGDLPLFYATGVDDNMKMIEVSGAEKPLPEPFAKLDQETVKRFVPTRGKGIPKIVKDKDAAFGYAAVVNQPDSPFQFGFYQNDRKKEGPRGKLKNEECIRGEFKIYPLGEIEVTPDSFVWFSARSWETNVKIGERLYSPPSAVNDNRYDVYVSLKFIPVIPLTKQELQSCSKWTTPVNDPYSVLCDQVIFVHKTPKKQ